jgi:hypothetical protein
VHRVSICRAAPNYLAVAQLGGEPSDTDVDADARFGVSDDGLTGTGTIGDPHANDAGTEDVADHRVSGFMDTGGNQCIPR